MCRVEGCGKYQLFRLWHSDGVHTTYRFAKCLQRRFGIIKGVTDKNYITNSYHVHVTEEIDAFSKLKFESDFQKLSSGWGSKLCGGAEYAE